MEKAKQKTKGSAGEVDKHVGKRLRVRRSLLGISQEKLAEALGVTFQQIQKYERGINRISAGRLHDLSKQLEVPINYFFDKFEETISPQQTTGFAESEQDKFEDFQDVMNSKETLDLIRVYYSIENPTMRKDLFKFLKSMAERMSEDS